MIHRYERIYQPGTGNTIPKLYTLSTFISTLMYMVAPCDGVITTFYVKSASTLEDGATDAVLDLIKNGTSVFSDETRPKIVSGQDTAQVTGLTIPVTKGDRLDLRIVANPKVGTFGSLAWVLDIDDGIASGKTTEEIQDIVGAMMVSGTNIDVIYDYGTGTITFNGKTFEEIQDMIATFIQEGANIDITYNDATNTLTISASAGSDLSTVVDPDTGYLKSNGSNIIGYDVDGQQIVLFDDSGTLIATITSANGLFADKAAFNSVSFGALKLSTALVNANVTLGLTSSVVIVDTTAARTITLPSSSGGAIGGTLFYFIKDSTGSAGTNNITILPNGAQLIDGASSKKITSNYGWLIIAYTGVNKWSVLGRGTGDGFNLATVSKNVNYTVTDEDTIIDVDSSGAARTITLLSAIGRKGKVYIIKDAVGAASTNTITIATTSGQTIDAATTATIVTDYGYIWVRSDGANWKIIGRNAVSGGGSSLAQSTAAVTSTGSLGVNAFEDTTLTVGKYAIISRIVADRECRVRIFNNTSSRGADTSPDRAIGTDPVGEHGVLLDVRIMAGNLDLELSPPVIIYNSDSTRTANAPIRMQNLSGSAGSLTVTVTKLTLEQ